MYILKHVIGTLAMPLAIAMLMAVLGAILGASGRRRPALHMALGATVLAYLCALGPVGGLLLAPLESQYPPLAAAQPLPPVHYVVVLGGGYTPRGNIPVTGALDGESLQRIVEGVGLIRRLPSAKLVASGGAPEGKVPCALGYAELARALGVPDESIVVSERPLDTGAEAHSIVKLLGNQPFLLVTSAYHMPRAMSLMKRAGARPIPAPTGQLVRPWRVGWQVLLPNGYGLTETERALHEYLGLAALAMGIE